MTDKQQKTFPLTEKIDVTSSKDIFQFKVGKEKYKVPRTQISALLFYFGNEVQQEEQLRVKKTEIVMERRALKLKAKKDIKKGEMIEIMYEYPASATVRDLPQKAERLGHELA